jgi:hypothetical protein
MKIGLGVGVGLGIPILLGIGAAVGYFASAKNRNITAPKQEHNTASSQQSVQQIYGLEPPYVGPPSEVDAVDSHIPPLYRVHEAP